MFELWIIFICVAAIGLYIGAEIVSAIRKDRRRFQQMDWVAEHKRRLSRNGFKSRMGMR